jgi:hypothetical protein
MGRLLAIAGALTLATAVAAGPRDFFESGQVKLTLRDAPAVAVLEALATVGGLDLVVPPLPGVTLTVHLASASVAEALDAIADVSGLVIEIRGRIMVVFAPGRAPPAEPGRLRFARAPPPAPPVPEALEAQP